MEDSLFVCLFARWCEWKRAGMNLLYAKIMELTGCAVAVWSLRKIVENWLINCVNINTHMLVRRNGCVYVRLQTNYCMTISPLRLKFINWCNTPKKNKAKKNIEKKKLMWSKQTSCVCACLCSWFWLLFDSYCDWAITTVFQWMFLLKLEKNLRRTRNGRRCIL